jgi:hypothetical protein
MPKVLVFSPTGEKVFMEPVDARECIAHCGYDYAPPKNLPNDNRQVYRGFPNNQLDAGELGLIQFDAYGVALVTPEQAKWLDDGIAVGLLGEPNAESGVLTALHDESPRITPETIDKDDTQELGTGEPSAGDPAEGAKTDANATVSFINTGWANQAVDAGDLGVIQFDAEGGAIVTQEQAVWLAAKAAENEAAAKSDKPAKAKK